MALDGLRERAIRMAADLRRDAATKNSALRRNADRLAVHPESLRNWVTQAEINVGDRPGTTSSEQVRESWGLLGVICTPAPARTRQIGSRCTTSCEQMDSHG